jgi:hypothetical protein
MAAGVVSGAVALLLQANPSITPDRAKFALLATARRAASDDPLAVGRGTVQTVADDQLGTVLGPVLGSVLTVQLLLWNPLGYTGGGWRESDWYLSTWNVFRFYRVNWHGSSWYGQEQDESYGSSPSGSAWYGAWD